MRKDIFMKLLPLILVVLLCITPLMANVRADNWAWTKGANNTNLNSIDMVSSTDGWAVGTDGIIIHWDGTSWSNVASPTGAWLSCVDMLGSTDGWIVGADGVYRWQEVRVFPTDYLVFIIPFIVVIVLILVVVLVLALKRHRETANLKQ